MNELALFAGAGGGILGGNLLGWRTICAVEWDAYAASILVARQNDGCLPPFPIWDDVQTFDGNPWRGRVDVVSGGFPCQDISCAGRGAGIEGERSSMWKHMARIIGEVLPQFVFVENSPMLVGRGLAVILADLAEMGYDAEWGVVGAHHAGAPHKRDRIWVFATNSNLRGCDDGSDTKRQYEANHSQIGADEKDQQSGSFGEHRISKDCGDVADPTITGLQRKQRKINEGLGVRPTNESEDVSDSENDRDEQRIKKLREDQQTSGRGADNGGREEVDEVGQWWAVEPNVGRVAHGVASRVDRLKAIGNGQVPAVARLAWETLNKQL